MYVMSVAYFPSKICIHFNKRAGIEDIQTTQCSEKFINLEHEHTNLYAWNRHIKPNKGRSFKLIILKSLKNKSSGHHSRLISLRSSSCQLQPGDLQDIV